MGRGYPIVLTASRAEMSQFGPEIGLPADAFEAFKCTFPRIPAGFFLEKFFAPVAHADGRARFAPYGLRKIEAALSGAESDGGVVVCHPDHLESCVGDATGILGISTMDPLGLAYVSTTYNSLVGFGGESVNAYEFKRLLRKARRLKRGKSFKIVVGGEAVWQIDHSGKQAELGIDHLVSGRSETDIPAVFESIRRGTAPRVIRLKPSGRSGEAPAIRAPAIFGDVEITRGCGRGCAFCSPNLQKKHSVALETVLSEIDTNIRGGGDAAFIVTDDMFLYRSKRNFEPDLKAITGLFEAVAARPGLRHIHLSHASIAPVLVDPKLLPELAPIFVEKSSRTLKGKPYATVEIGIESGSPRIMSRHMPGKALPLDAAGWPDIVCEGVAAFNANRIYPLATIIVGWPGEDENDALLTAGLIERLHRQNAVLFYTPIIFIPLDRTPLGRSKRISLDGLTGTQLAVIERCWELNVAIWGSEVPAPILKIVGVGAKGIGIWRRLTGARTAGISNRFADFMLRTKFPCDPGACR